MGSTDLTQLAVGLQKERRGLFPLEAEVAPQLAPLKPNSITLASSELALNMFEAGSCQIPLH